MEVFAFSAAEEISGPELQERMVGIEPGRPRPEGGRPGVGCLARPSEYTSHATRRALVVGPEVKTFWIKMTFRE